MDGLYMCFGTAEEEKRRGEWKMKMKMGMVQAYTVCSPGMNAKM